MARDLIMKIINPWVIFKCSHIMSCQKVHSTAEQNCGNVGCHAHTFLLIIGTHRWQELGREAGIFYFSRPLLVLRRQCITCW